MRASIIKRRVRSPDFCTPFNHELGLRLIDHEGIDLHLAILQAMGEPVQEFESFVSTLLLVQLSNLHKALEKETDVEKSEVLQDLIFKSRQKLWPLKN